MNLKLAPFLTLLALVGCGVGNSPRKTNIAAGEAVTIPSFLSQSIHPLYKQSSSCSVVGFESDKKDLGMNFYLNEMNQLVSGNFSALLSGNNLKSLDQSIIQITTYGEEVKVNHFKVRNELRATRAVLSEPKEVEICPEVTLYNQGSIESAALNSTFIINKANAKVKAALPTIAIKPLTIKIGTIYKHFDSEKFLGYQASNAFYSPSTSSIDMLPSTKDYEYGPKGFWEVGMVPAHEYGHHVFHTLFPEANEVSTIGCFDMESETQQNAAPRRSRTRGGKKKNIGDVNGGINEGFADLIAYYSLSSQENSTKGVGCLQTIREVDVLTFPDGQAKNFSKISDFFFDDVIDTETKSCDEINFQAIHIFGAVFASSADQFLTKTVGTDKSIKLQALLEWAQDLRGQYAVLKKESPENYLKLSLGALVSRAHVKANKAYSAGTCQAVADLYPGLKDSVPNCSDF